MSLGISDDVFVLHLSLETPQCALKGLAILNINFSQLFSLSLLAILDERPDEHYKGHFLALSSEPGE